MIISPAMTAPVSRTPTNPRISRALEIAFAPVHKRALGLAVGLTAGLLLSVLTAFHVVVDPVGAPNVGLLAQYLPGYAVTWAGVLAGAAWGSVAGFVAGWLLAFFRNFTMAVWKLLIGTRAELRETASFLDHL